jgi:uroporphyrinogen decarboxylase
MEFAIRDRAAIGRLEPQAVAANTAYQPAALKLLRRELGDRHALLGFAGAPWTLATYMVEGGSSKDFSHVLSLLESDPQAFHLLMEKLVDGLVCLLRAQIDAGADAVQLFDSWAGILPSHLVEEASLRWIRAVIERLDADVPVILFAKGVDPLRYNLCASGAHALAAGPEADLPQWRRTLPPHITLQGNLHPDLMTGQPQDASAAADQLLAAMRPWNRYIFNLGHGITPQARVDCVEAVLQSIANAPLLPA